MAPPALDADLRLQVVDQGENAGELGPAFEAGVLVAANLDLVTRCVVVEVNLGKPVEEGFGQVFSLSAVSGRVLGAEDAGLR